MKKIILIGIGSLLMINATCMVAFSNMHIGLIATFLLGVIFLLCGLVKKIPLWFTATFLTCVLLVTVFISFLLIYGSFHTVTYQEDAVIVLGSGTAELQSRLDVAIAYYKKNPSAVIVVSGGQGEALTMERYLLEQGIPQEKIMKEEKATNTYENFVYAKELLDAYFDEPYTISYITNTYHIYRAGAIAQVTGFESVTSCSGATPWYSIIPSCIRECIGVVKFWILGT